MFIIYLLARSIYALDIEESIDRKEVRFIGKDEPLTKDFINAKVSKTDLEKVTVDEGITGINNEVFSGFSKLSSIFLPKSCTFLGTSVFQYCGALKTVVLPEGLVSIGDSCFLGSGIVNITFPSTFTENIKPYCFYGCSGIKNFFVAQGNLVYSTSADHSILIKNNFAMAGYGDATSIKIPSNIVEIYSFFLNGRTKITSVDFSEATSLRAIGSSAFRFTSIQRITFPQGIINITNMFDGQSSIAYAYFPKSLQNVGNFFNVIPTVLEVEDGCSAVYKDEKGIVYDAKREKMLYLPPDTSEVFIELTVKQVIGSAIRDTKTITSLSVAQNHEFYAEYDEALYSSSFQTFYVISGGVKTVKIHPNCLVIDSAAFESTGIETINMSQCTKLVNISGSAFLKCQHISSIVLPDSVKNIFNFCFSASSLSSIVLSSSLEFLGSEAFRGSLLRSIDFRKCQKLKEIQIYTFLTNSVLEEVFLPPNLESLSKEVFENDVCLKRIEFPSSFKSMDDSCFLNCNSLSEVIFHSNLVTTIPINCFMNCNLSSISLPSSVILIETESFKNNFYMTSISFGEKSALKYIQVDAFAGCNSLTEIELGADFDSLSPGALSQMESLTTITVLGSNTKYSSKIGVLYNKDGTTLVSFPGGIPRFKIETGVKIIASRAFFGCSNLNILEFADDSDLQAIGTYTFYGCSSLVSLVIPPSVSQIDSLAFGGCTSLKNVTFIGRSKLTNVSQGMFEGCQNLRHIEFSKESSLEYINDKAFSELSGLSDFVAPPSLREIGVEAFYGCRSITKFYFLNITTIKKAAFRNTGLTSVFLNPYIESVETDAFRGCESLKKISFCGRATDELQTTDVVGEFGGRILVSANYGAGKMFGKEVTFAFDKDCLWPTQQFTVGGTQSLDISLAALTVMIFGDSSNESGN